MTKLILKLTLLLVVNSLNGQELKGVWLSTDNQLKKLATTNIYDDSAILIDFDKNLMGAMAAISSEPIGVNRKKTKIKASGIKGRLKVQTAANDILVIMGKKGVKSSFKKLDLSHNIQMNKKELTDFLLQQQCGSIQDIKGKFTSERFFLDKPLQNKVKRSQFINFTDRENGYWYFKTIRGNAFFVFTLGKNEPESIFQLTSLQVRGFNLWPFQADNRIKDLKNLKVCL